MEEEVSSPHQTPLQETQEPWTFPDHQHINGEQEAIVSGRTDDLGESPSTGPESPEEDRWVQVWSVRPVSCAGVQLSVATVLWDMPGLCTEEPTLMTEWSLANELDSGGVTRLDGAAPSRHRCGDDDTTCLTEEEEKQGGEREELESQLLDCDGDRQRDTSEPCDAADVREPTTQEEEGPSEQLLHDIPFAAELGVKDGPSSTSGLVETVELDVTVEDSESADVKVDSLVDFNPEEEQEESDSLSTGPGESEGRASPESVNTEGEEEEEEVKEEEGEEEDEEEEEEKEEESEGDEEQSVTRVFHADSSEETKSDVVFSIEPLHTGLNTTEGQRAEFEEVSEILEQLLRDLTTQTGAAEMHKDVEHRGIESDQQRTVEDDEEASAPEAAIAEEKENSEAGNPEETSCLEGQDCELTALTETGDPEAEVPRERQEEHCEDHDQSQHLGLDAEQQGQRPSPDSDVPQPTPCEQPEQPGNSDESATVQQLCVDPQAEAEVTQPTESKAESEQVGLQKGESTSAEDGDVQTVTVNGGQHVIPESVPHMNGGLADRELAARVAEQLFKLDGILRVDVVKHLDKDNDFSRLVGEEYLKFFDFSGQTLDQALRSFLKVVVLIGESQERERVLEHFSRRYHQCNPDSFPSSGAVLALTCALMLLNTDLHGQHVGKSMSSSKFVSNLDTMNDGENFSKDLLKSIYNSIKNEPLEWAIDEEELKNSVLVDDSEEEDELMRSKTNPFQQIPLDKKALVVKEGFLQRKLHADTDGKRTPWGKRGWKTIYGVLKGMVLFFQKSDYRREQHTTEEVVGVHHSLAEPATDYTKKPHVFRLQTADWRVFLFQASSKVEMNSWISRLNLVSALQSSPPFPAAVGSQRKFFRPILPASLSAHTLDHQLQSHTGMLESFRTDLSYLHQNLPEGKKARAKELEENRVRAEYLQFEMCRYEIYIQVLEAWKKLDKTADSVLSSGELLLFDRAVRADFVAEDEEEDEGGLKKAYSSPSLKLELAAPSVKVKRNISERRTYRRIITPRSKES